MTISTDKYRNMAFMGQDPITTKTMSSNIILEVITFTYIGWTSI